MGDPSEFGTLKDTVVNTRNEQPTRKSRSGVFYTAVASTVTALFVIGERSEEIEKWFLPDACYFHDVATGEADKTRTRPCLHGKPVYIQWNDNTPYPSRPPESYNIGNRVVTIESSDPGRPPFWREAEIIGMDGGKPKWHGNEFLYTSVIGSEQLPLSDHTLPHNNSYVGTGFVLRRTQIVEDTCNDVMAGRVPIAELLIKNFIPKPRADFSKTEKFLPEFLIHFLKRILHQDGYLNVTPEVHDTSIFFRSVILNCGDEIGTSPRVGPLFRQLSGGPVTKVIFDP